MSLSSSKACRKRETYDKTRQPLGQRVCDAFVTVKAKLWNFKAKTVKEQQGEDEDNADPGGPELKNDYQDSRDEYDDEDEPHPRCDWKTIDAISDGRYEELVTRVCTFEGPLKPTKVLAQDKGTFNAVTFVGVLNHGKCDKYIVRVPGHATIAHWTAKDAYMMQREIEVIEYIRRNTSAPLAQVCSYSTDFRNILGHPYIMMTMLPGKSAYSTWFDKDIEDTEKSCEPDSALGFRFGDVPSPATEKKRIALLRSLARIMAEINSLSFNQIGMPIAPLDDVARPTIGPSYRWDNTGSDIYTSRPPLSSTQCHVSERPTLNFLKPNAARGALKLLDIIFSQPVFNAPLHHPETFTLHHADLDLQNLLVDDDGNITGIIDWDRCLAVPRCFGASSSPLFLQKDWMPAYLNNLATSPYMAFTTHRYRQIYATALAQQGCEDAKFTTKSAMYQAGVMSLYDSDDGDVMDFLTKVLRSIPHFRSDVDECLIALGKGWPAGEETLRRELRKLFEPELPDLEAPIKKRTTARAKSARAARPVPAAAPTPDEVEGAFGSSKRDKLKIKHSSFVSKIEKSAAKSQKRRRPNKKLVANLESLADALPGLEDGGADGEVEVGQAKIQRKSLKSRPGATKRKEKLVKSEMDRFNKNLAQLAGSSTGSGVQDRWAALKSHVQNTMEVKPEFTQK
ncbi:hypothetical protein N0V95_002957 [Ascochyta clinopodiicola]|nr:hypothetical protein N0V95_002957 [Ascochyta clinopodiicola]